jgi:chemotaxis protein histidine kinase CheA/ActR/RegA family two-component response regulator
MNPVDLLQSLQLPLSKLLDNAALLDHSNATEIALDYHEHLGMLTEVAQAQDLRGLGHVSRLFESGLQKRLSEPRDLEPNECAVLSAWPELVMAEMIGGTHAEAGWTLLHRLCEQPWMPHVPEHFVTRIESLLTTDAHRFEDGTAISDAAVSHWDMTTSSMLMTGAGAVVPVVAELESERAVTARLPDEEAGQHNVNTAFHSETLVVNGTTQHEIESSIGGGDSEVPAPAPAHLPTPAEGKVTADELAMVRDALAGMRDEFAPQFVANNTTYTASLESYAEQLENILNAAAHLGLAGFQNVIGVVQVNVMSLQLALAETPGSAPPSLLISWLDCAIAYLDDPTQGEHAYALASLTVAPEWTLPASEDDLPELIDTLMSVEIIRARAASDRPTEALNEHMDLHVPADVDRAVLNSLLHELPQHAQEFSEIMQRLALGGSLEELEHARRVAHTLKGAGNTVGIKGVGNLTHALEDILVACGREERMPTTALHETLIEAADCLEAMSESLLSGDAAPPESVLVYQKVLDWANLIDREGLPAEGAVPSVTKVARSHESPTELDSENEQSASPAAPGNANATATEETETYLRVPATLIDSLLKLVGENSIVTSQIQDRVARLTDDLNAQRTGSRQIRQLSSDLEQLVDVRGLAMMGGGTGELDALEMDQYNELHMLSRRIVESAADSREFSQAFEREVASLRDLMAAKERVQLEIQRSIQRTRMVEVSSVSPRLQRTVRQAARVLGKDVRLVVRGESTLVDTQLLNRTLDPLMHMLRNAVDHGIENADVRLANGKGATGTITLTFQAIGSSIKILCADDGGGIDLGTVRSKAINAQLINADDVLTDAQVMRLIMLPGFSTREQASLVSGRGIGMDVVQRAITELRGTIDTKSTIGEGTSFAMSFPVQLSATQVMISQSPGHLLAVSERSVEQLLPVGNDLHTESDGSMNYVVQGERIPALRLENLLALPMNTFQRAGTAEAVMIVFDENRQRRAVIVPELSESRNVVVKPFTSVVPRTLGVDGATILGDGSVASVIDLPDLLRDYDASGKVSSIVDEAVKAARLPLCLIVDDSVSVRRTMEQLMQDAGYEIASARDGIDALGTLQRRKPDIVLVDLEMPRMNGLEFTNALRNQAATKNTPVVMITSRFTEKHRKLAEEAGVNAFMTKPYREEELLGTMQRLLQEVV